MSDRPFAFVLRDALADLRVDAMPQIERAVIQCIASYADPNGANAFPSIAEIRRVTGYSLSRIVEAVQGLARRGWLTCHERFNPKTRARSSTGYTVNLAGEEWPESEARAKRRAASRLPPGGKPPPPPHDGEGSVSLLRATEGPPPHDGGPPLRTTEGPLASDAEPLSVARNRSALYQPSINPFDQPMINPVAPVRAHGRGHEDTKSEPKGEAVALPLFPTSATGTPLPASGKRPKRDPSAPKAADLYAAAYVAGHADAGGRMSPLTKAERALLGAIAGAHARGPDGAPLTGEAVIAWFRGEAKAFRKAVPDPQHHRGGYSPIGFRSWLDNGAPKPRDPWAVKPGELVQPRPGPPPPRRGPPDDDPTPEERQRRIDKVTQYLRERAEEAGTATHG